jgi:hypothetical protein
MSRLRPRPFPSAVVPGVSGSGDGLFYCFAAD